MNHLLLFLTLTLTATAVRAERGGGPGSNYLACKIEVNHNQNQEVDYEFIDIKRASSSMPVDGNARTQEFQLSDETNNKYNLKMVVTQNSLDLTAGVSKVELFDQSTNQKFCAGEDTFVKNPTNDNVRQDQLKIWCSLKNMKFRIQCTQY